MLLKTKIMCQIYDKGPQRLKWSLDRLPKLVSAVYDSDLYNTVINIPIACHMNLQSVQLCTVHNS